MKKIPFLLLVLLVTSLFNACKKDDDTSEQLEENKKAFLENYADIVYASYEDSRTTAVALQQAIDQFVSNPTEAGFEACKTAWKAARIPYGQTEAYRFYGGPIDDEDGPEGLLNAWPLDENFIDYVAGNPDAGLINNPTDYPEITKEVLEALNESISETSIFTGYHAIEFLLWGQDLNANGAGQRPYTDYVAGGTAANQDRRSAYLKVVAALLVDHLNLLLDEWQPTGAYRKDFLENTDVNVALGRIFTALGELSKGELSGERMFVAVDSGDQENEHSCFSDNTHVDIEMNYKGIENVYFGVYTRINGSTVSGISLDDLALQADIAKANTALAAFTDAKEGINAIPTPFDQAILNNEALILEAVESLSDLSDRITDVGFALGAEF
ncbi:MAG TPA: imelysin family protein [Saprospiraceae bacterium]|nr:imelysin family protein [Saprospiraceae bacterium]HMQ84393.1 imelysin family protein [Saprospiraceae bacterium]